MFSENTPSFCSFILPEVSIFFVVFSDQRVLFFFQFRINLKILPYNSQFSSLTIHCQLSSNG